MSRRLAVLLLLVAATGVSAYAQGAATRDLTAIEQRWAQAVTKNDVAALEKIFADGYVDTDEEGHQSSRSDVMALIFSSAATSFFVTAWAHRCSIAVRSRVA